MNAALSNSFGWASFIFSALAVLPCASSSSLGGRAASCAATASARGGGCEVATARFFRATSFFSAANFGSAPGPRRASTFSTGAGSARRAAATAPLPTKS